MKTFQFQCNYCDRKYKKEHFFIAHECDQMIRTKVAKTPMGMRMYDYYSKWNSIRGHKVPPLSTFITSQYYKSFERFDMFVNKSGITSPIEYIKVMHKGTLPPTMWTNHLAYKHFIDYMDNKMPPMKQVGITVDNIFHLCREYDLTDTADLFDVITPNKFIQSVVKRQLSPWFLFNSKKFRNFYKHEMSTHNRTTFDELYSPAEWGEKFRTNKSTVAKILPIIGELGL